MNDRQKTMLIRGFLLFVGVMLVIILAAEGLGSLGNQKIDTEEGLELIHKAENADITTIENKIAGLEAADADPEEEAEDTRSIKERFESSVVMGDSMAMGFSEYDVLNPSSVVAEIGIRISDEEKVKTQIAKAKEMNPQMLFLCYGLNDIKAGDRTLSQFLDSYKLILDHIKKEMPNTKVFVNSIFPVQQSAVVENQNLAEIEKYNEELRNVCDNRQIAFITNTDLVETQYYEDDGIHFVPGFYDIWAAQIAEVAEL